MNALHPLVSSIARPCSFSISQIKPPSNLLPQGALIAAYSHCAVSDRTSARQVLAKNQRFAEGRERHGTSWLHHPHDRPIIDPKAAAPSSRRWLSTAISARPFVWQTSPDRFGGGTPFHLISSSPLIDRSPPSFLLIPDTGIYRNLHVTFVTSLALRTPSSSCHCVAVDPCRTLASTLASALSCFVNGFEVDSSNSKTNTRLRIPVKSV